MTVNSGVKHTHMNDSDNGRLLDFGKLITRDDWSSAEMSTAVMSKLNLPQPYANL